MTLLLLSGACGGGESDSPHASKVVSIGFANDDSDVIAVLPEGPAGKATIVIMRADAVSRGRDVAFVREGVTEVEVIADADGRLGELLISEHYFVFSDYTKTQVTVTRYGLEDETSETWQQDLGDSVAMQSQALRVLTDAELREIDQEVDGTLRWVADLSRTYLPLMIHRKAGEAAADLLKRANMQVDTLLDHATKLAVVVRNKLTCSTATRTGCAPRVAASAQTLAVELRAVDPEAKTTAGFIVDYDFILADRADWDPLIMNGEISTEFTLKDVPCAESVFAEMNPDCPQYIGNPSAADQDGGSPGVDTSQTTRQCKETIDGSGFKLNCKQATYGTCEESGWVFIGTYDSVLDCGLDIPATAEQLENGDSSPGPNSNEATGKGSVAGSGAGGTGGAGEGSAGVGGSDGVPRECTWIPQSTLDDHRVSSPPSGDCAPAGYNYFCLPPKHCFRSRGASYSGVTIRDGVCKQWEPLSYFNDRLEDTYEYVAIPSDIADVSIYECCTRSTAPDASCFLND